MLLILHHQTKQMVGTNNIFNQLKLTIMSKKDLNVNKSMENEVQEYNEDMQSFIKENYSLVPRVKRGEFDTLTDEEKVEKIKFYQERIRQRAEAIANNTVPNRVKALFEKRHATVDDAKEVLNFCKEFIDNFNAMQIEKIDEKIAELVEMKLQFT